MLITTGAERILRACSAGLGLRIKHSGIRAHAVRRHTVRHFELGSVRIVRLQIPLFGDRRLGLEDDHGEIEVAIVHGLQAGLRVRLLLTTGVNQGEVLTVHLDAGRHAGGQTLHCRFILCGRTSFAHGQDVGRNGGGLRDHDFCTHFCSLKCFVGYALYRAALGPARCKFSSGFTNFFSGD